MFGKGKKSALDPASRQGALHRLWWFIILRGVFLILFGLMALVWPGLTLVTLVLFGAIYLVVAGIFNIAGSVAAYGRRGWFLTLLLGAFEMALGVIAFRHLGLSVAAALLLFGWYLVARGVIELVMVIDPIFGMHGKAVVALSGLLAVVAGIIVLAEPVAGGVAFVWVIGLYALIAGALLLGLGITARHDLSELRHSH